MIFDQRISIPRNEISKEEKAHCWLKLFVQNRREEFLSRDDIHDYEEIS